MKLNPYQITAFTEVAREGSFSGAAAVLGVTQSSITQHIAKLETSMGTQLFVRRHDGVELTRAARELFEISDRLRTMEERVAEKVASYSDLQAGHLKIIANAPRPAMPLLKTYVQRYPGVEVEFSLYDWTTTRQMLRNREVDLAVITNPDPPDGATVIELEATAYMAHMHAEHPLASRNEISLIDLCKQSLIVPEDGSLTQLVLSRKLRELDLSMPNVIKTRTFPVMKEAVLHGIGIGLILENSLYPSSGMAVRPIQELSEHYRHCLVIPSDKAGLRTIERFVELASESTAFKSAKVQA